MYINVYKLKEISKEDYERIIKRSETETDSILEDVKKIIDNVKEHSDSALLVSRTCGNFSYLKEII